jgi:hypothetical protein
MTKETLASSTQVLTPIFLFLLVLALWPASANQLLYSKDHIVKTIKLTEQEPFLELLWGKTDWSWNKQEIFVAIHSNEAQSGADIASIYRKVGEKFELLEKIRSGLSHFIEPKFFWHKVEGKENSREHLIDITEVFYGTGNLRKEHVFAFQPYGELVEVEFVPASISFKKYLGKGEAIWKGETNLFGTEALTFTLYIWRESDQECCPTGGKVTGTYSLEEAGGKYRISMSSFTRQPYESVTPQ